jgi:hypothetical protein
MLRTCRRRADGPRGSGLLATLVLGICADALGGVARVHLQDALAAELLQGHLANASAGATCRDRLPEVTAKGGEPAQFDFRTDC